MLASLGLYQSVHASKKWCNFQDKFETFAAPRWWSDLLWTWHFCATSFKWYPIHVDICLLALLGLFQSVPIFKTNLKPLVHQDYQIDQIYCKAVSLFLHLKFWIIPQTCGQNVIFNIWNHCCTKLIKFTTTLTSCITIFVFNIPYACYTWSLLICSYGVSSYTLYSISKTILKPIWHRGFGSSKL